MCQQIKNRVEVLAEKLKLSKTLERLTNFVATTEGTLTEELVQLFRDNIQKLYGLPESMVLDRELQFVAEITKELNKMLEIEMKLLTVFYPQTDSQTKQINQELE